MSFADAFYIADKVEHFGLCELGVGIPALLTMMGRVSAQELERYVRTEERTVITAFKISQAALAS